MGAIGLSNPLIALLRLCALIALVYSFVLALRETHKEKRDRDFALAIILGLSGIGLMFLTGGMMR